MRFISRMPMAIAKIRGSREAPVLRGAVRFYQLPAGILIEADISGLPNNRTGFHGFHIHMGSSCAGEAFAATGRHYDPDNVLHPMHAGDLPPLLAYNGNAYMAVITDRFSLSEIIDRTVVIHLQADDFHTQPAGNAGDKIACGVIERYRQK